MNSAEFNGKKEVQQFKRVTAFRRRESCRREGEIGSRQRVLGCQGRDDDDDDGLKLTYPPYTAKAPTLSKPYQPFVCPAQSPTCVSVVAGHAQVTP